ncbi:uncharacterized protein LTR77_001636 [Saxophila tyrrhenica]|uniref:Uncharacterized protein n=1 Tax=Saxophila tyrrhenica TaxID=1690608 RepID=A0AAV9PLC9_9PEZI|nr:hypothetical protein LTR77_001636 [Saxophila tyrrhenica]
MIERYSDDERPLSERKAALPGANHLCILPDSRQPLIERVNNPWQDEKAVYHDEERELPFCDLEGEGSCPNLTRDAVRSRRTRNMLFYLLVLVGVGLLMWRLYLLPHLQEEWEMKEGFMAQENGTYGITKSADFDGTQIEDLDSKYVPGGEHDPKRERRLVFVGDVHGCAKELKKLLHKVDFDEEKDHLIAVGDVISKGPDNVGVLDELMRIGASSVRGNHEDRILTVAAKSLETDSAIEAMSSGAKKDRKLLKKLHKKHLKYLESMPLMLRVPALPQAAKPSHRRSSPLAEEIIVVHGGLVPAVELKKQDPYFVMNMRGMRTKSHLPLAEAKAKHGKSKPWHDIWDWYNDRLYRKKSVKDFAIWDSLEDANEPTTGLDTLLGRFGLKSGKKWPKPQVVVYGHHSKAGLQNERWSKGLDTGCVSGGELTAMVLDAKGSWSLTSVGCPSDTTFRGYTSAQVEEYARRRGGYPKSLIDEIIGLHGSTGSSFGSLLDLGCGPGSATRDLAPHFDLAFGLDPSDEMLRTARAIGGHAKLSPIQYMQGDAEECSGVPDESVDLITAVTAGHWFDMDRFWPTAARVLRPGGTVAFSTIWRIFVHPRKTPHANDIQEILIDLEQRTLGPYQKPGNWSLMGMYADLKMPWSLGEPCMAFAESSYRYQVWNLHGVPEKADGGYVCGEKVMTVDETEKAVATISAVTRWREAHSELAHTQDDCVVAAFNEIKAILGVGGDEKITMVGPSVLVTLKKS